MSKFSAGVWIISIILVYAVFFTYLTAIFNSIADATKSASPGLYPYNPGFNNQSNPFFANQQCTGRGNAMTFLFPRISCSALNIPPTDNDTCNEISGCSWDSNFFGIGNLSLWNTFTFGLISVDPYCSGYVNLTAFNITGNHRSATGYCSSSGLQSYENCTLFQCTWINNTDMWMQQRSINDKYSAASIWDVIKWVIAFQFDIGWGDWNWIISMLFYLIFAALVIATYFLFVPW